MRRLLRYATINGYFLRAAFFAPFFAAFFLAAMVLSSNGVKRSIEPPVVRTSQWSDAGASFPPRHLLMASR